MKQFSLTEEQFSDLVSILEARAQEQEFLSTYKKSKSAKQAFAVSAKEALPRKLARVGNP